MHDLQTNRSNPRGPEKSIHTLARESGSPESQPTRTTLRLLDDDWWDVAEYYIPIRFPENRKAW